MTDEVIVDRDFTAPGTEEAYSSAPPSEPPSHCTVCEGGRAAALQFALDTVALASEAGGFIPPEPANVVNIAQGYEYYIRTGETPSAWVLEPKDGLNSIIFEGAGEA